MKIELDFQVIREVKKHVNHIIRKFNQMVILANIENPLSQTPFHFKIEEIQIIWYKNRNQNSNSQVSCRSYILRPRR